MRIFYCLLLIIASCASTKKSTIAPSEIAPESAHTQENADFLKYREEGFDYLYKKQDAKKAFELFQKAADMNDPVSIDVIGGFYSAGYGGAEKSCKKAIEMYSKAALMGYPLSANNLAYSLVTCPDPKQRNPERAKKLVQNLFQQSPFFLALLDTYAAALAESKEKKKAIVVQKTVIDIANLMEIEPERLKQFEQTLSDYEKRKR